MSVSPDRLIRQKKAGRRARARAEMVAMSNIRRQDPSLNFQEAGVKAKQNIAAVTGALGHFMQRGASRSEATEKLKQLTGLRKVLSGSRKEGGTLSRQIGRAIETAKTPSQVETNVGAIFSRMGGADKDVIRIATKEWLTETVRRTRAARRKAAVGTKPPGIR